MKLKNLMVVTDHSDGCAARIETALVMADKFDAHLTGVYAQLVQFVPQSMLPGLPSEFQECIELNAHECMAQEAHDVAQLFQEKVGKARRTEKATWREIDGPPDYVAAVASRYADLVIAGQCRAKESKCKMVDPGVVVTASGRPMFVVPQDFAPKGYTAHAVVGWNGSREAARAMSDALMILGPETRVTVAVLGEMSPLPDNFGFDIIPYLQCHGIAAQQVQLTKKGRNAGMDLIHYAQEVGADLIVMGAYGRSRLREEFFGGATHWVLKNMVTPVLLSH